MAEEPTTKRPRGEMSDHTTKLHDVEVLGEKFDYTKKLESVECKWQNPYSRQEYDSLADVATEVVQPLYENTKKKINREEDHKLWGNCPLPHKII
ncbi:hypothetical protein ZWY2020_037134 [Hordeum vulgare]|nr:hypothetical protein ZWY2020_037134 [Hordeum vulgare]